MRHKQSKLLSLKDIIPGILNGEFASQPYHMDVLQDIQAKWHECVGPELTRQVRPLKIYKRKLIVEVPHPSWAHEFEFLKHEVLRKLQKALPGIQIQEIRCQIATGSIK